MAHVTEVTGKYSQVIAKAALMAAGYEVAETETDEPYDFVAKDPVNREWVTFQCKTISPRKDRNGELIVYATNGNGEPYSKEDVDYIVGVLANDGEPPRVFCFENRELREYWATEETAVSRWVELPITLDREKLKGENSTKESAARVL